MRMLVSLFVMLHRNLLVFFTFCIATTSVNENAPHTQQYVMSEEWNHPYSRAKAAFPVKGLKQAKFWPTTSRLNDTYGDRNLVCSCPPIETFLEEEDAAEMSM